MADEPKQQPIKGEVRFETEEDKQLAYSLAKAQGMSFGEYVRFLLEREHQIKFTPVVRGGYRGRVPKEVYGEPKKRKTTDPA